MAGFGGGGKRRRYDWVQVKQVYVEGSVDDKGNRSWKSLGEVADLFEIPHNRCREASARENWVEQRAAFQAHMEKVRQEKRAADLAKEAVDLDAKALAVAKMGVQLTQMRMGEIARAAGAQAQAKKAYEDWVKAGRAGDAPDYDEFAEPALDARELHTLAASAAAWHTLGGKALGEVETTRTELTGANGAPLEVRSSIKAELTRDDPQRLHALLIALDRAQLLPGGAADAGAQPAGDQAALEG